MSTMAEGTYEYECMRAELLGIEKPDYEEFLKKKEERIDAAEEEREVENLTEADDEHNQMKHLSGGLDELNSILQVTQRKINRFKASCSSFTNLLKFKIGGASSEPVNGSVAATNDNQSPVTPPNSSSVSNGNYETPRRTDLSRALDNNLDKLDGLIEKAENAQFSMSQQNKKMKKFL